MASKSYEKLIDEIGNMSVLELADFVKALEETFGVSAAMPVMQGAAQGASAGAQAVAQEEEKAEYKVVLQDSGAEKIKTIKALRKVLPELNLSDAKKAAEETPYEIAKAVSKDKAMEIKKELEAAGAKVTLS